MSTSPDQDGATEPARHTSADEGTDASQATRDGEGDYTESEDAGGRVHDASRDESEGEGDDYARSQVNV